MSDADQAVNRELAQRLFKNVMGGKPRRTLDIGAKLPVFAAALHDLGCDAWALEHEAIKHDLHVQMIQGDFEQEAWLDDWPPTFGFISLIHVFEHVSNPLETIRRLRKLVADDGAVFIRIPDHSVPGFERDLTVDHYAIHPYYHALPSILQCLYETRDTFVVSDTWALDGIGQRDIVLRPIKKAPTIALGMIVKNEEVDLPRCLESAKSAVDHLCLIDTGSTDKTMEVAAAAGIPGVWKRYTGASRKDETGDWKLEDFSKARNVYLGEALRTGADWVLTLDADDVLTTPDAVRRASYYSQVDCIAMWIKDGATKWVTHRMWKPNLGIRYDGRCHEYPELKNAKDGMLNDCLIEHHGAPGVNQENSNARNLRMLMLEWAERQTPRCAFYIANTHRDGGRWKEAAEWYGKRIAMGEHYRDEWLFSYLYVARALFNLKQSALAKEALQEAVIGAPDWMEFPMELAHIAEAEGEYEQAIELAKPCCNASIPPTNLWRETRAYRDGPARLISWCHEHMGNPAQAFAWSVLASKLIGGPDSEWDQRQERLREAVMNEPTVARKPRIALLRPGAIGDIIMTLNLVPLLKAKYPNYAIDYYCAPEYLKTDALGTLILAAGCDMVYHHEALRNQAGNYREVINLVGYPLKEGYPEQPMRQHLLRYFAEEMGVVVNGALPQLSLPKPAAPLRSGPYATLQRHAGWSKYKEWPDERWEEVLRELNKAGIPVLEIDAKFGLPLATSIALIANAAIHIGVDSFGNHLTHYLWDGKRVPGVILWGSTQWDAAGYTENVNLSKQLACQPCFRETHPNSLHPRPPCTNLKENGVHACMDAIETGEVVEACTHLWKEVSRA